MLTASELFRPSGSDHKTIVGIGELTSNARYRVHLDVAEVRPHYRDNQSASEPS
jgi:hypothetical protein